ncbi:MFS transporter [Streptomyces zagrosensis]|uniref:MFS family permease n=1 Tax=Streptomyces zagrosensis TaxID=1042984 RepID=A0A7W9QCQ2_9ACTN|nr:MFS transporter [Streptomyces zagrosensis]MBB5937855.1 MFS family permease [Streptomyces zagrosensis]
MKTWSEMRGFPLAIRLLLINQLGVNTGFYLLIPYLATHLSEDLGMSAAVVGIVLGVRNLSQQGLFIIGGSAADRLGARGVIIAGCALRTVGFGLFALGDGLPVLLAASVLSGLAGALFNPAVRAYLAQEAGDRKVEAFALFNVFASTGALIGPLLGSALLLVDFRASALTAAAIFALLTVAQAMVLPARKVPPTQSSVLSDWREVVGNRAFLAFSLAMVGMFTMENQLYLLLPDGARRATGWEGAAGLVFVVGTVANLTLQMRITGRLKERGARARWISGGLALMGLAFVPPLLVTGAGAPDGTVAAVLALLPVLAGALLLYLGVMIAQPFVMELIPQFGRSQLTGTYFGIFYVVSGIAAAVGNTVVGWAMDAGERGGAHWLPWVCCAGFGLASAGGVAWLHRLRVLPATGRSAAGTRPEDPAATGPRAGRPRGADAPAATSEPDRTPVVRAQLGNAFRRQRPSDSSSSSGSSDNTTGVRR